MISGIESRIPAGVADSYDLIYSVLAEDSSEHSAELEGGFVSTMRLKAPSPTKPQTARMSIESRLGSARCSGPLSSLSRIDPGVPALLDLLSK